MRRSAGLALLCLTLFLALFPLGVGKPGLPMTLKADEPAYYLMALSLARDLDLRCDLRDLGRLFDEYPYLAAFNLILMTDDGWHTVYFGKPYIYSLLSAPFAGAFGANGLVAFNMLLLLGMVWMGATYLGRYNPAGIATLYSVGFFLLSTAFSYVFWLHPEIFNMTCVAAALFLALHSFEEGPRTGRLARLLGRAFGGAARPGWSGALLALAAYNKPMLAALALPILWLYWRRRHRRGIVVWLAAAAASLIAVAGMAVALTGHPSAYLGVERMGVPVFDPQQMPVQPVVRAPVAAGPTTNSWMWLARIPEVDLGELAEQCGYFLWGRHTGLIPYLPFAVISLVLFATSGRPSSVRWLILAAMAAVAMFFLVWIPFNWHGGGGFVGNRYFVNVYPAFLFLVTRIRPRWLTAMGYAAGGILLGPILFTPLGAAVPEPTLQAHVRNPPLRWLPLELEFRDRLPGYRGAGLSGAWFFGRKDVFRLENDRLQIHGATPVELWMLTSEPISTAAVFLVENRAPENRVAIDLAGDTVELAFEGDAGGGEKRRLELEPRATPRRLEEESRHVYAYRLLVRTRTGFIPNAARNAARKVPINDFYLGVSLMYLGTRDELDRDLYRAEWSDCELPAEVAAGQTFTITTRIRNASQEVWPSSGPTRVHLSYHWLAPRGGARIWEGRRTALPTDLVPGSRVAVEQTVVAPNEPGVYRLELDLVREEVSWFSQKRSGAPCRRSVTVVAGEPTGDSPAP